MEGPSLIISECCPVGCGIDVAVLRARQTAELFVYCIGCESTWTRPAEVRPGAPLDGVVGLAVRAPGGAELASLSEVAAAGWSAFIIRSRSPFDWAAELGTSSSARGERFVHE